MKQEYTVTGDRFIGNVHHEDGDKVSLTDAEAKYLAPPYGNAVAPVVVAADPVVPVVEDVTQPAPDLVDPVDQDDDE